MFRGVSIDVIFSSMCNTKITSTHSTYSKTFTFTGFLNGFEFITPRLVEFHTMFLFLGRSWLSIFHCLFLQCFDFFDFFVSTDVIFSSMCNTKITSTHSTYSKTFTFTGFLNGFEFITPRLVEFHTMFLFLGRSWLSIFHCLFLQCFDFFHSIDFTW